jgi:tetratricopeptide (TPR) repeat protein
MRTRFVAPIALLAALWSGMVLAQYEDPNVEGRHLFEEKKFAEAAVKFKEALNFLPNDPSILSWLAACHLNLNQLPEAEDALARAIAAGGKEYRFFELLAATQFQLKKYDDAIESFRQSIRLKPDFGRAYYNLGRTLLVMGNRDAALEQYTILTNIDQNWAEKLNAILNP